MANDYPLPFFLPPYPQLIMEAIEACTLKKGCSLTKILKHIEATQPSIPPSNRTLVNYHLNKMMSKGQIARHRKDHYIKPDPNAPPKPRRGRPPKQKDSD